MTENAHDIIPVPAYRIVTQRLVIRCWEPKDAPLLKAATDSSIDHLLPWMTWAAADPQPVQKKIELIRHFRSKFDSDADYVYGVFNADESEAYGGSGLHTRAGTDAREIGYWITKAQARHGYATETAGALTKVAFEVSKMRRVEIHVAAGNEASIGVARKLGYVHEATLRQRLELHGGEVVDRLVFSLLADEYPKSPSAAQPIQAFDVTGRRLL